MALRNDTVLPYKHESSQYGVNRQSTNNVYMLQFSYRPTIATKVAHIRGRGKNIIHPDIATAQNHPETIVRAT